MHEAGVVYRDNRLVNWDARLRTAVSDIEVDYIDVPGRTLISVPGYKEPVEFGVLTSFAYPLADGSGGEVVVAEQARTGTREGGDATDLVGGEVLDLDAGEGAVGVLGDDEEVEDGDDATVDEVEQGCCGGAVEAVGFVELQKDEVDRSGNVVVGAHSGPPGDGRSVEVGAGAAPRAGPRAHDCVR